MAVAIKICYPHHVPVDRESWTEPAANENVVVRIADCCLVGVRITEHIIRVAVVIKVGQCSPLCYANGKNLVRIGRIYQGRGGATTWNVDFVPNNRCPDSMPRRRHIGQPTPAVSARTIDLHLCMQKQSLRVFPAENPKLIVDDRRCETGAGGWHRR